MGRPGLNNISIEELIEQAKNGTDAPVQEFEDDILGFISFYNIKAGDKPFKRSYLYKLYKAFTKAPLSSKEFEIEMSRFFMRKLGYFMLDVDALDLNKAVLDVLKDKNPKTRRQKAPQAERCLKHYKITDGPKWVESFVLYYLYDKWAYSRKLNTIKEKVFTRQLRKLLKEQRFTTEGYVWFCINDISHLITKQEILEIRQGRKWREKLNKRLKEEEQAELKSVSSLQTKPQS